MKTKLSDIPHRQNGWGNQPKASDWRNVNRANNDAVEILRRIILLEKAQNGENVNNSNPPFKIPIDKYTIPNPYTTYPQDNVVSAPIRNWSTFVHKEEKPTEPIETISDRYKEGYDYNDLLNVMEGFKNYVYKDSKGYLTAGRGHKLTEDDKKLYKENDTVPYSVLNKWSEDDTKDAKRFVKNSLPEKDFEILTQDYPDLYNTMITMAIHNPSFVTKLGSPKFNMNLIKFLNNPSKENMDSVVFEMNRSDEYLEGSGGIGNRYGLTRYLFNKGFDDTLNISVNNWKEEFAKGTFNHYGVRK